MFGLIVAAAGVYGLTRYLTISRTREIGLRMALGAPSRSIVGMVARQTAKPVACGLAVGVASAVGVSSVLSRLMVGMPQFDWAASGLATMTLVLAGALAILTPALKAVRVDPVTALR